VGYALGRWERQRGAGRPRRDRLRDLAGTVFGLIVVAAFVVTYLQGAARTTCYRDYFTAVSANLAARSADADATGDLQIRLLTANASTYPALRDQYVAALERQKATRAAARIPQPPDCG
jgi:hypothetical protein